MSTATNLYPFEPTLTAKREPLWDTGMALTRLDCYSYRGRLSSLDTSSFVALNPGACPGRMVLAGARAVRESIGSQVACRLSVEHFVEGILDFYVPRVPARPEPLGSPAWAATASQHNERSLQALEAAFKKANKSVYSFGHSLSAGGRMAASFLALVLDEDFLAAGRVGGGGAYLYRAGELFPFFEAAPEGGEQEFLGTQSLVSVELASVPIEARDIVVVFSEHLSQNEESKLTELLSDLDFSTSINPALELSQFLFDDPDQIAFALSARIGDDVIYLRDRVA